MTALIIVLKNVSVMMAYLLVGILVVKSGKAKTEHAKSISTILIYVCGPCMVIKSFLAMECTRENTISIATFFFVTLAIQAVFFGILFLLLRNKLNDSKYRIMSIGGVLGNVGFLGMPLVMAVFPESGIVSGYSSVYTMSMNIIVFSIGVFMITGDKSYMSLKAMILNPTTIAIAIAIPFYVFDINLPEVATDGIILMGRMTTPLCMFVLGMRLAAVPVKNLVSQKFSYISCFLKQIAFPLFAYMCVRFIPFFNEEFKVSILVLSAVPTAAVVLSLAEIHEQQQELAANVVLLSTIMSIITIPLIMLVV